MRAHLLVPVVTATALALPPGGATVAALLDAGTMTTRWANEVATTEQVFFPLSVKTSKS